MRMRNPNSMNFNSKKINSHSWNFITSNKNIIKPQLCRSAKQQNDNELSHFWIL